MSPIILLKELSLLENNKTVLDIGTKNGWIASSFANLGMEVDAIDPQQLPNPIEGVHFEQIGVEDFIEKNERHYDIVVCRHVIHLLPNPVEVVKKLNEIANIFFFTCFGEKDDWSDRVSILEHNKVLDLFPTKNIRHHSEAFQYAKTYAGDMKYWHINTFVLDNRSR